MYRNHTRLKTNEVDSGINVEYLYTLGHPTRDSNVYALNNALIIYVYGINVEKFFSHNIG